MQDPCHVFLNAQDVMARYGWGKTKGYRNLRDRSMVPPPFMTHPYRWRLDQLLSWEEKCIQLAEAEAERKLAPEGNVLSVTDLLPRSKRQRSQ